jgi:hypothetical protein
MDGRQSQKENAERGRRLGRGVWLWYLTRLIAPPCRSRWWEPGQSPWWCQDEYSGCWPTGTLMAAYVHDGTVVEYEVPGQRSTWDTGPSNDPIALLGDDGLAYVGGQSQIAFEVATGTVRWTAAVAGTPTQALAQGRGAVLDGSTLTLLDETGQPTETAAVPLSNPRTFLQFGQWLGRGGDTSLSPVAVIGPLEIPAPYTFPSIEGESRASDEFAFQSAEDAALRALDFIYPFGQRWEWAGFVCLHDGRYLWSRFVTDHDSSTVHFDPSLCDPFGTPEARFDTHPPNGPFGDMPSAWTATMGDCSIADANPDLTFYLKTPGTRIGAKGMFMKYRYDPYKPDLSSRCNIYDFRDGIWVHGPWDTIVCPNTGGSY